MTDAHKILDAASQHMRDRAATYDKPEGERSMSATVAAFAAVTGHDLTTEQGWLFMALLKAVRSQQGNYKADNYEDLAAYAALAGEAAAGERGKPAADAPQESPASRATTEYVNITDYSGRAHLILLTWEARLSLRDRLNESLARRA